MYFNVMLMNISVYLHVGHNNYKKRCYPTKFIIQAATGEYLGVLFVLIQVNMLISTVSNNMNQKNALKASRVQ